VTQAALTDEQQVFVEAIRDFAAREKFERPESDGHDDAVAARMGELGWYGLQIPEEYGGSGGSFLDATLFLEETTRGGIPIGGYGVTLIVVGALNRFGSEEQKRELFARVVKGGTLAIAMSEPDAGSDVAALKTKARREDGEWVLDGAKMWCSYAHKASQILIVCRTGPGERHEDMSMILVPRDAPGMTLTPIATLGGEETNEIHLDGVRVPEDALLGAEGAGWTQLMAGLNYERTILAATALGLAQRAFDDALAYSRRHACSFATWPRSQTRTRRGCCRARPRWRSSQPRSWPSAAHSRGSRSWAATATPTSTPWRGTCVPQS
jgi:isovaleryl-CoA dehydrogenase